MSANRYQEALDDAKLADELEPGNSKVLQRLARIYTNLGRPTDALDTYAQIQPPASARDKAPAVSMQSHIKQAQDALLEGTTGSMALHALDQAERGLGTGVDRPRKWKLLRGEAFLKMGNVNALGDAQNVAMSLLRVNSQDPEALVLRGRALYAQGDNDKALQHFRQALSCDPDFKDAVKYLRMVQKLDRMKEEGNAAFKAGRYQQAVDVYGQALEVDPFNKGTNSKLLQNRAMASIKVWYRSFPRQSHPLSYIRDPLAQRLQIRHLRLHPRPPTRPYLPQSPQNQSPRLRRIGRLASRGQRIQIHRRIQPFGARHRQRNPHRRTRAQEVQTKRLLQDLRRR